MRILVRRYVFPLEHLEIAILIELKSIGNILISITNKLTLFFVAQASSPFECFDMHVHGDDVPR